MDGTFQVFEQSNRELNFCSFLPRNFITGDNVPVLLKKCGHLRKKCGNCGENDKTVI